MPPIYHMLPVPVLVHNCAQNMLGSVPEVIIFEWLAIHCPSRCLTIHQESCAISVSCGVLVLSCPADSLTFNPVHWHFQWRVLSSADLPRSLKERQHVQPPGSVNLRLIRVKPSLRSSPWRTLANLDRSAQKRTHS